MPDNDEYRREIEKLKGGYRKSPSKKITNRNRSRITISQAAILAVLLGLIAFFLKDADILSMLSVLGVTLGFAIFILIFRKPIEAPVKNQNDPFEPGSDAYFTYGPGSED